MTASASYLFWNLHFLCFLLLDIAMTISIQKFLQVFYLLIEVLTYIRIGYQHSAVRHFYNLGGTLDVGTLLDGIFGTGKRFVLYQLETTGMVYQRVAGDTRLVVVCLGETTVYHHQLAVCLDRVLTLQGAYRYVTIDDMAVRSGNAKLIHDMVYHLLVVA